MQSFEESFWKISEVCVFAKDSCARYVSKRASMLIDHYETAIDCIFQEITQHRGILMRKADENRNLINMRRLRHFAEFQDRIVSA